MFSTWTPKLVEPIRWLIIIGIAATLAQSVLFVIAGPQRDESVRPVQRSTNTETIRPAATSINAIVSRNLFGAVEAGVVAEAAPTMETRLPLELRGVFVGDKPEDSAAIIAQKGKNGELFIIGAVVPGNAELRQVHPDHVILRRAGNLEKLTFPEERTALVPGSADNRAGNNNRDKPRNSFGRRNKNAPEAAQESRRVPINSGSQTAFGRNALNTPREFVDDYRAKLDEDPEAALAELGIAPVSVDGSKGYRLGNLAQSPYLSQTGLQPGDIVLSVNGSPVGNIQQDRAQIDGILNQGAARLEVQRGTRRFFVTASLKQ